MNFGNFENILLIAPAASALIMLIILYGIWRRWSVKKVFGKTRYREMRNPFILIKEILLVVGVIIFAFIMLRPQWGITHREVNREGSDILIILDVSRSMLAKDIKPSRLEKAKSAVRLISGSLQGDRAGIVLFAGNAFLQCPLTSDMGAFEMFLDNASPESIRLQGTDVGKALNMAAEVFDKKRITTKIALLITDGEDHEKNVEDAIAKLKESGVKVFTASVGTNEGEIIPMDNDDNTADIYLRDSDGKIVRTKPDAGLLKMIAESTDAEYFDINGGFSGIYKILDVVKNSQKSHFGTQMISEPEEKYYIFALILSVILLLELFVGKKNKIQR